MMQPWIAPSILSADFARLGAEVEAVLAAGADIVHFDVMDNHYVPNLTIGPLVCEALRKHGIKAPIDVHLMVTNPIEYAPNYVAAGADTLAGYFTVRGGGRSSMPLLREKGGVHRARRRRRRRRACGSDAPLVPARSTRTRISTRRRCAPARRWCACSRARRSP